MLLCIYIITLYNFFLLWQIEASGDSKEKVLVFFKSHPTVITEDNLHQSLLVSSMLESPINTLYQAVRQVFAPVLLKVNLSLCVEEFHSKTITILKMFSADCLLRDFGYANNFAKQVCFSFLKDEHWRSAFDPKLADLLNELEVGLGSVVRHYGAQSSAKKGRMEEDVLGNHQYIFAERNIQIRIVVPTGRS